MKSIFQPIQVRLCLLVFTMLFIAAKAHTQHLLNPSDSLLLTGSLSLPASNSSSFQITPDFGGLADGLVNGEFTLVAYNQDGGFSHLKYSFLIMKVGGALKARLEQLDQYAERVTSRLQFPEIIETGLNIQVIIESDSQIQGVSGHYLIKRSDASIGVSVD